jgi:hypothetical protein
VSACNCGCRSIGLEITSPAPPAPTPPDATLDYHFAFGAYGTSRAGNLVAVNVHVLHGRLSELEIWDGGDRPFGSTGETPELNTLEY